ncbi:PucR family transcriptional regulator [Ihubacter sp. rT4E-8]|uniref:PucR family transcriptional regulator n=1 Tax=Ihubacter sp. rT4E-8 TaxID=3242369 RepID=UPI003CF08784
MNYTVSDFYETFHYGLKIIAGHGGMSRIISDPGILDYELDAVLRDKYLHTNFHENQLVVTTFSCAKDNPFMVSDAIKHLIAKDVSCLVIKNVFKLPIHETILRYADAKNFPIFLIDTQEIYIENIICEVNRCCRLRSDMLYFRKMLSQIFSLPLSSEEIITNLKKINPSCQEQFFTIYIKLDTLQSNLCPEAYYDRFCCSDLNVPSNALILLENSLLYIHSEDNINKKFSDSFITHILQILLCEDPYSGCGVSQYHLTMAEFKISLQESVYAASMPSEISSYTKYSCLGSYRIIFPFVQSSEMNRYAKDILKTTEDYDIENNSHLLNTLQIYIETNCDLTATAKKLSQHKNTIRYRLNKIKDLTGLDYKNFTDLEQLSLALRIYQCRSHLLPQQLF